MMFQMLLELLPGFKHNVSQAMEQIPSIRKHLSERIANLPEKEDVKDNLEPLLEALSVFAEDDVIDDLRSRIENRLDGLPTKDDIDQRLQNALDQIPSAEYVNGKVDELVDQ